MEIEINLWFQILKFLNVQNLKSNHKFIEEYSVRIYKNDLYCYKHYKKIRVDKNGCEYILFRIDAYFSEYSLAVKIDEKGYTDRDFIFEEKKTKNIVVNLLELIQAM